MLTFWFHPSPSTCTFFLEFHLQIVKSLLVSGWHGVREPGAVGVDNLQAMVASIGESLDSNLPLEILDIAARDDRDLAVRELTQSLQGSSGMKIVLSQSWTVPSEVH